MKLLIVAAACISPMIAIAQSGPSVIICTNDIGNEVLVETWKDSRFSEPLHCIHGNFVYDLTPCAPQGGWGLSSGFGRAGLSEVTQNWQTASNWPNGKVSAMVGALKITFKGGFGEGLLGSEEHQWTFEIDRETGGGTLDRSSSQLDNLTLAERAQAAGEEFSCLLVERKF
jgi:hypothetical protein